MSRLWPFGVWDSGKQLAVDQSARFYSVRCRHVRITAVRKLAVEAADNGLPAPELASVPLTGIRLDPKLDVGV